MNNSKKPVIVVVGGGAGGLELVTQLGGTANSLSLDDLTIKLDESTFTGNIAVADIAKQIASGQNRAVQVPQKIPVYVSYFTAWPNKDGVVEYFDDVYGRDGHTAKAFKATTDARAPRV